MRRSKPVGPSADRVTEKISALQAAFPEAEVMATIQCAGHRRKELAALQPIAGEIPCDADATGTATWRSVALREVLLAAGIVAGAGHVAFLGLDSMEQAHPSTNYFQAHAYKLFPAHVQSEAKGEQVWIGNSE